MIVVATDNFELYHELVGLLRKQETEFTTQSPSEAVPATTSVLLHGPNDTLSTEEVRAIEADPQDPRQAIERALAIGESDSERRIIGVDPGDRPGIAVVIGNTVVAAFQVPLANAPQVIRDELSDADDPLVRIGDGARLKGTQLIEALDDVPIELVDETRTTPTLGAGASGSGDILAAVNIAQRPGEPVESREVDPTPGEIERIKQLSRRQSPTNRAINSELARQVALGELSIEEALAKHRSQAD